MSFVKLKNSFVRQRCERTKAKIEEKRRECEAQYVANKLEETNSFRRFFRLKLKTFEEVKERCQRDWNYPSIYAWKSYDTAQRLIDAADTTNADHPYVYVDTEDIELVWKWS